jgi:GH24 family phage-related lysozyme (muramidase)
MANQFLSLRESWSISENFSDSFTKHFFRYLSMREGVVLNVYKDAYKYDTVGIGHLVRPGDNLKFGDVVSKSKILDLFRSDMSSHRISELRSMCPKLNIAGHIAISSFVWAHGPGEFIGSQTLRNIQAGMGESQLQDWVKRNWDLQKPINQARNKADLQLIYPRVKDGIVYHISELSSGTFVYVPSIDQSFTNLAIAIDQAKKKVAA